MTSQATLRKCSLQERKVHRPQSACTSEIVFGSSEWSSMQNFRCSLVQTGNHQRNIFHLVESERNVNASRLHLMISEHLIHHKLKLEKMRKWNWIFHHTSYDVFHKLASWYVKLVGNAAAADRKFRFSLISFFILSGAFLQHVNGHVLEFELVAADWKFSLKLWAVNVSTGWNRW